MEKSKKNHKFKKSDFFIIIQARLTSKRFPYKVLMPFKTGTILSYLIEKLKKDKFIKKNIYVAIPKNQKNLILKEYLKKKKFFFFEGSEENVYKRFHDLCKRIPNKFIIRLTADNPLISTKLINFSMKSHFFSNKDISSTRVVRKDKIIRYFPKGQSVDIFNKNFFVELNSKDKNSYDREHIISFLQKKGSLNILRNDDLKKKFKLKNYSIDSFEDYIKIKKIK